MLSHRLQKYLLAAMFSVGALVGFAPRAAAVPVLQIYIEGSTYDATTETWVWTGSGTFTLWVIGNVEAQGTIEAVKLAGAVQTSEALAGGTITLGGTTANGIVDPSVSADPGTPTLSADGAIPQLWGGASLPTHGEYGPGTSFFEWQLGDFTLLDSPIGDFIDGYPVAFPNDGQINAYTVTVTGLSTVHFDAYDHVAGETRGRFAPFSHDAQGGGQPVPEPGTLVLLGTGLCVAAVARRRARKA